ncbi:hypothetical protein PTKIN_Ptkin09bG0184200 [Pterospermum kingtungense]
MGYSLGNGSKISFWSHEWILGNVLQLCFPRLYALAVLKNGKVKDHGEFVNGIWCWRILY